MPLKGPPGPATAAPSTTRVHAAISNAAPHNSSGRVNLAICRPSVLERNRGFQQ
jgi:hypothetical protein